MREGAQEGVGQMLRMQHISLTHANFAKTEGAVQVNEGFWRLLMVSGFRHSL